MIRRHYFTLFCFLLAAHVTGCRTSQPTPDERATASVVPPPVQLDTVARVVSPPAPGILSGIGHIFSTPAGIERRQAVRLARASVPRKMAKGAVYAPQARQVVAAYKPTAAVVLADSGAMVTAIGKVKAPVAIGAGATATQAVEKKGFWATVASALSWWWLLIPVGYVAWRVYRSTIPFA